jgi:hypothetical protein
MLPNDEKPEPDGSLVYASIDEPDALSKQQECRKQIAE